jgi:membrane-associated phospholipid phosphatase
VRRLLRLRPEEAIALAFLLPTTYLTLAAHAYAREAGAVGPRYSGGVWRLLLAAAVLGALGIGRLLRPQSRAVRALREIVPFVACILIYTNLHDTIGFVNPHDIHWTLVAVDQWLFGVQPCVWTERFITPGRTEFMTFLYFNFFWIAPSVPLLLLGLRRWREFRQATLGVVLCFFMGYFLYVAFPAAPPRLVLVKQFSINLYGYPHFFGNLQGEAFAFLPTDSRAAFPSLHAAISLVALVYAWRFLRPFFWLLLPFALGLWISTVYLRHHYVIDLLVGWCLAPLAIFLGPRLDAWWAARQRALGYETARGAP